MKFPMCPRCRFLLVYDQQICPNCSWNRTLPSPQKETERRYASSRHRAFERPVREPNSRRDPEAALDYYLLGFFTYIIEIFLRFSGLGLLSVFLPKSKKWIDQGNRYTLEEAEVLLQKDKRSPIVYLRSFASDSLRISHAISRKTNHFSLLRNSTLEDVLKTVVSDIGPLIAIGNPFDEAPHEGAARMYIDVDDWRKKVLQLIAKSQLVFVQIGDSEGLIWEIERIAEMNTPKKLILCLRFDEEIQNEWQYWVERLEISLNINTLKARFFMEKYQEIYNGFRKRTSHIFPHPLPELSDSELFLYFGEDWTPYFLGGKESQQIQIDQISQSEFIQESQIKTLEKLNNLFIPLKEEGIDSEIVFLFRVIILVIILPTLFLLMFIL